MTNRAGISNYQRFPIRYDDDGYPLCRMCGKKMLDRRRTFCSTRCLRDFKMVADWNHVRQVVYVRDGGVCMKCGKKVDKDNFHVDHIIPISAGGDEWDLANLELSCPECNLKKGSKIEGGIQDAFV